MRHYKYVLSSFLLFLVLFGVSSASADMKFTEQDEPMYDKLCSTRSGYTLNRHSCEDYEKYKLAKTKKVIVKGKENSLDKLKTELEESTKALTKFKGDATELAKVYRKTDSVVQGLVKDTEKLGKEIKAKEKEVELLDKEIQNSIVVGQELDVPNSIVDVVMGSTSVDTLITNFTLMKDFQAQASKDVIEYNKKVADLKAQKDELNKLKKKYKELEQEQEDRLLLFRAKEAEAYTNSVVSVSDIDLKDLKESNCKLGKNGALPTPVNKGIVTAGTWYYSGTSSWHSGLDIGVPEGTKIVAPCDGVVLAQIVGGSSYGLHTLVAYKVGDKVYTFIYAHLSKFGSVKGNIKRGDVVGYTGNTGNSTGPHVHTEVFKHNTSNLLDVVKVFNSKKDLYFGLRYNGNGDCSKGNVCRLKPEKFYNVKMGQKLG